MFSGGFGANSGLQVVIDIEPHQYMSAANQIPAVNVKFCMFSYYIVILRVYYRL